MTPDCDSSVPASSAIRASVIISLFECERISRVKVIARVTEYNRRLGMEECPPPLRQEKGMLRGWEEDIQSPKESLYVDL